MDEGQDFDLDIAPYQPGIVAYAEEAFSSLDFIKAMELPLPDVSPSDRREALSIYHNAPDAPSKPSTPGAARMLNHLLSKHDYALDNPTARMRNYVMFKFFELAEHEDARISMKALENLAKTSDIGLFSERIEVNINQKSVTDLSSELKTLLQSALSRTVVNDSTAIDAEYSS